MPTTPRRSNSKAQSGSRAASATAVPPSEGITGYDASADPPMPTALDFVGIDAEAKKRFDASIKDLQEQIANRPADKKMSIKKKTPSHQIHNSSWKDKCYRVNVDRFNEILGFKQITRKNGQPAIVAVCGGQVQMGQLCKATIPHGFVAKQVPEYNNFTVAGLINGEGIQTSAFKWGNFTHTVLSMTVVLGNGEVVTCDEFNETELFDHMPETYGTLGIVVAAEVELTPCLRYVRNDYTLFSDLEQYVKVFDAKTRSGRGAFLEGLVLAQNQYLLIESTFVNEKGSLPEFDPVPEDNNKGEKWHFQYISNDVVRNGKVKIPADVIPVYSYLFRYIRGAWWMTDMMLNLQWFTKYGWCRKIIDNATEKQLEACGGFHNMPGKLTREEEQRCYVLQDMGIKLSRLQEGVEFVQKNLGVYPLWLCPVNAKNNKRLCKEYSYLYNERWNPEDPENFWHCDIGIYGEPTVQPFYHFKTIKAVQEFVDFPNGWGVSYEDPSSVRERHRPIREKYHAQGVFPGVEEKITFQLKDEDEKDLGPVPQWRLVKEYGRFWPLKCGVFWTLFFTILYFGLLFLYRAVNGVVFTVAQ